MAERSTTQPAAKKPRRSAVDDVLGSQSPILGTLARQLTAERPATIEAKPAGSGGGGAPQHRQDADAAAAEASAAPATRTEAEEPGRPRTAPQPVQKPRRKKAGAAARPAMPSSTKRAKRVLLSSEEEAIFDELLAELSARAGVRLGFSHVTRAMWEMLLEAEHTFPRVSAPSLTRPATQDADATAEFESEIKAWLIDVIQTMPRRQR